MKLLIGAFSIISFSYIASYTLVAGFFYPLQTLLFPNLTPTISLLFLPHGIRILAAYYYGWKSFLLIIPAAYFMWIISVYGFQIPLHPIQPIVSVLSCILGIKIISKKLTYNFREDIPFLIIAGIIGSILNGLFNSLLINDTFLSTQVLSYIFGDVLGQIVLMLLFFQTLKFIDFNR
jgi:uncharacterized membrane protein YeaQ/YmgE (transglycosylase-associated protein family)